MVKVPPIMDIHLRNPNKDLHTTEIYKTLEAYLRYIDKKIWEYDYMKDMIAVENRLYETFINKINDLQKQISYLEKQLWQLKKK